MTTTEAQPSTPKSTPRESPREAVKRELAEAILDQYRANERVKRAYVATEAPKTHIAVRELGEYLNAYPGIIPTRFTSWGRRRATAAGRPQYRNPVPHKNRG